MKKKKLYVIVLATLTALIFIACGKKTDIVGQWQEEGHGEVLELFSNGTGTVTSSDEVTYTLSWTAENERLKVSIDLGLLGEQSFTYDYKLDSSSLVLTNDAGEETIYTMKE